MNNIFNLHHNGKVTVDGKVYENINGNVEITDRGVFVNGVPIAEYEQAPVLKIEFVGRAEKIECDNADVTITGDVGEVNTINGNVNVGHDVLGNCESKNGNIFVEGKVSGNVVTKNGSIHHS
ncbi:MAG: hypothetical protein K6A67_05075 [Bacteroidales bacterium]|nr:hypothetical protein [Bacteroidales bacterium]